ncbi:MAG: hypothetical protein D6732_25635 [Methanobacteriota archaeon]|nr:MAG: hypothetical protein D6732_25635 [Euryarchaeota archaeon]
MTCDRVVIINEGKVVAQDTVENLTLRLQGNVKINLEIVGDGAVLDSILGKFEDIVNIERENSDSDTIKLSLDCKTDIRKDLARELVSNNIDLLELSKDKLSLEEAFLHLTTKEEEVQV